MVQKFKIKGGTIDPGDLVRCYRMLSLYSSPENRTKILPPDVLTFIGSRSKDYPDSISSVIHIFLVKGRLLHARRVGTEDEWDWSDCLETMDCNG